jgi:hypothetical protein
MTHDRATVVVRTWVIPIIAAALRNHPQLDVSEVLGPCRAPLEQRLREEFEDVARQAASEVRA